MNGGHPASPGRQKNATTAGGPTMSVIVVNPINGREIIYTDEEYGKAYIEACEWYRALENAVETPKADQRDLVK